jgi:mono/diheme cytochrome c family protein
MRWKPYILILCTVLATGCGAKSPKFTTRADSDKLISDARAVVKETVDRGFGSPTELVAWTGGPIDYGTHTGVVTTVSKSLGLVTVELEASEESTLATDDLSHLVGSAVLVKGGKESLRVGSYDEEHRLQIVASDGSPATHTFNKGDELQIVGAALQKGRGLYLRHCMHCHGVSGGGNGPTAEYLNPLPRDYRDGLFKFTSTKLAVGASRHDLYRTIKLGIPSTYMPSFMLLPDDDVRVLAEYVRWLAARGMVEKSMVNQLAVDFANVDLTQEELTAKATEFEEYKKSDLSDAIELAGDDAALKLSQPEADDAVVMPSEPRGPVTAESLKRGRELFMHKDNNCFGCHGEKGRGDGASNDAIAEGQTEPGLFDDWGNKIRPRNLTRGVYRGGRRPIDIYRRIRIGIKGAKMPNNTKLSDADVWHLVNYVYSIPFEDK